jgi:NitT/TauT family transport system substrate-binding protein
MGVLRAYATKGAPVRIIGANMTGSANYWYVSASSSIKTMKDIGGRTIAYSKSGASGQYDVFDFMERYRAKARPVLTPGATATFDQVISGKIDVGWAAPPYGIDAIEQDQIRVLGRANDIPKIREKTVRVMIANADTLQTRKDVLTRFVQGYRESLEWMYSDPAAPKAYAQFVGASEAVGRRLRDEFFTKDMLSPDNIMGLKCDRERGGNLEVHLGPVVRQTISRTGSNPGSAACQSVGERIWRVASVVLSPVAMIAFNCCPPRE